MFRLFVLGLRKAVPRFELGIKNLQSSALPLGHTAMVTYNLWFLTFYINNASTITRFWLTSNQLRAG